MNTVGNAGSNIAKGVICCFFYRKRVFVECFLSEFRFAGSELECTLVNSLAVLSFKVPR